MNLKALKLEKERIIKKMERYSSEKKLKALKANLEAITTMIKTLEAGS